MTYHLNYLFQQIVLKIVVLFYGYFFLILTFTFGQPIQPTLKYVTERLRSFWSYRLELPTSYLIILGKLLDSSESEIF